MDRMDRMDRQARHSPELRDQHGGPEAARPEVSEQSVFRQSARAAGAQGRSAIKASAETRPWTRLDQALRAADLLLQGGGFGVVVLDLGSVAPEHVLRIPAATWFRFRALAEAGGTSFVLLSQAACARSSAALVLHFKPLGFQLAGGTVVEAVQYEAEIVRRRFQRTEEDTAVPRKQARATWQASSYSPGVEAQPAAEHTRIEYVATGKLRAVLSGDETGGGEQTRTQEIPEHLRQANAGILPERKRR